MMIILWNVFVFLLLADFLFICSIIIPYTQTSLLRWIFWVRVRLEREREEGRK